MKIPYVVPSDFKVPTMGHFHEGTELLGYWENGDSYLFRGFGGHILCVSRKFMEQVADADLTHEVKEVVV